MMRSKPKPRPSTIAFQMATVSKVVNDAVALKAMRVDGDTIYLFKAMFPGELKAQESYVRNLYYFAILDQQIKPDESFYLKDIETEALIAFYKNKKVMIA